MGPATQAATDWHLQQHGVQGPDWSECFCCCTTCNPSWSPEAANPYWDEAMAEKNETDKP
jgi:hypothetical protein